MTLPQCPNPLCSTLSAALRQFADEWVKSDERPRLSKEALLHWSHLVAKWAEDDTFPLYVRRASLGRGTAHFHESGRILVPTDNSPASWIYALALRDELLSLEEIGEMVESDRIPIAMILKRNERASARWTQTLSAVDNINKAGWKLAHIQDVALGRVKVLESHDLDSLKAHFIRFMDPANMFVVPKPWAGIAETPEMLETMRENKSALE